MPRTKYEIHRSGTTAEARSSQKYLRRLRETYVPCRLRRWVGEEAALMLHFDASSDLKGKLDALGGLIRLRLLILRGIGWPKEPSMKGGRMPAALDNIRSHNPLGDVDVESSTVLPEPLDPPPGA